MRKMLLTIFVTLLLACAHAPAIVGGKDLTPEEKIPFRAIVLLRMNGHGVCTASHLGGGKLLTAYHCLLGSPALEIKDIDEKPLAEIKTYEIAQPRAIYTEEVDLPDGKTTMLPQPDVAVITVPALAKLPSATIRFTPIPDATARLVAGFGFEDFAAEGAVGFATGPARTEKLEWLHYRGIWEKGGAFASIAHGDSGGPLIVMVDGKPVTFGVASTTNMLKKDRKVEYRHVRLDVDGVREWLSAIISGR